MRFVFIVGLWLCVWGCGVAAGDIRQAVPLIPLASTYATVGGFPGVQITYQTGRTGERCYLKKVDGSASAGRFTYYAGGNAAMVLTCVRDGVRFSMGGMSSTYTKIALDGSKVEFDALLVSPAGDWLHVRTLQAIPFK